MPMPLPESDQAYRDDLAACRTLLRGGSKSFFTASLILPERVRQPASALYAFCRLADDAVDLGTDRNAALDRLSMRLDRAYAGNPLPIPADRAFASVVRRFDMPRALPEALLEGLAWDAEGRRYRTEGALRAYAVRVAGAVGAMMAVLMGARGAAELARATDLGIAMQLTNIARDVGEDARAGRLYLPLDWLEAEGIDPEAFLADPRFTPELGLVIGRLLAVADQFYVRAEAGIAQLPLACRPGIAAARLIYAEIGRAVERAGCDSVNRRAVVPTGRKLALLGRSVAMAARATSPCLEPAAPEARYVVAAVGSARHAPPPVRPRQNAAERVGWVIDLMGRLKRAELARPIGQI